MSISVVLLVFGAIALDLYIPEKIRGYTAKTVIKKSIVSVLFIAVAVAAGSTAPIAQFIILGLAFGLLGDIWLDLKYVFPEHDEPFTYAGFTVFGIGHILFIAGMLVQYGAGKYLVFSFILAAVAAVLVLVTEKPMKLDYGKMKPIVFIYGFLLFATVFVSGGLLLEHGGINLILIFIGGVMFAISDLILSGTFFGEGKERPVDFIGNYVFYYGGQFLIAYSLVFI